MGNRSRDRQPKQAAGRTYTRGTGSAVRGREAGAVPVGGETQRRGDRLGSNHDPRAVCEPASGVAGKRSAGGKQPMSSTAQVASPTSGATTSYGGENIVGFRV